MLQGSNIGEVAAVVVRYFGGTKLGTGGLQRAYSASVRAALLQLKTHTKIAMVTKALTCQYNELNDVNYAIAQVNGKIITQAFEDAVQLTISIPEKQQSLLQKQLSTLSAGSIVLQNQE